MIRGTKRPVLKRSADLRANIHNRFDVEVIDAATGAVRQRAQAFNVICATYWTRLLYTAGDQWRPQSRFDYIIYGGGSGTPSAADTELFDKLGAKSVPTNSQYDGHAETGGSVASGVVYRQGYITLQAEENVGDTITEVGLGYDATHIVTHAMLEDMNGNPISITKTATDVIKIYATVYVHFPAGGWYSGTVMPAPFDTAISGTSLLDILAGVGIGSHYGTLLYRVGAGTRTGEITSSTVRTAFTVDAVNKTLSATNRLAATELNLPIRAIKLAVGSPSSGSSSANLFTAFWLIPGSWAPAAEIKAEAVGTGDGTTTGFATAFPIKTGSKVYVDGVEASGVTMRPGPAAAGWLTDWMNACYKTAAGTPGYYNTSFPVADTAIHTYSITETGAGAETNPFENPFSGLGVGGFAVGAAYSANSIEIFCSDDLETWTSAGEFTVDRNYNYTDCAIPQALRSKRYWKIRRNTADPNALRFKAYGDVTDPEHNIIFSSPPAAGAVITCDYVPDAIAKDENHVFDISLVLTLGEYQEA